MNLRRKTGWGMYKDNHKTVHIWFVMRGFEPNEAKTEEKGIGGKVESEGCERKGKGERERGGNIL